MPTDPTPRAGERFTAEQLHALRNAIHLELHDGEYPHTVWDQCRMRNHADRIITLIVDAERKDLPRG